MAKESYFESKWADMLYRKSIAGVFPWLSFDPENKLFLMEGGYIGAMYRAEPLSGINHGIMQELQGMLTQDLPADTVIQIIQLNVPDVKDDLMAYRNARLGLYNDEGLKPSQRSVLFSAVDKTVDFLEAKQTEGCFVEPKVPLTATEIYWTFKFRAAEIPLPEHVDEVLDRLSAIEGATSSFWLRRMDAKGFMRVVRRMFHIDQPWDDRVSPNALLRDQIMYAGDAVTYVPGGVDLVSSSGKRRAVVLSLKHPPEYTNIGVMNTLIGDPMGLSTQFTKPHALVWTTLVPDQASRMGQVRAKSSAVNYQAYGPMMKWVPAIAKRKQGIDALITAIDDGDRVVECGLSVVIWADGEKDATKSASLMEGYFSTAGFTIRRDVYLGAPQFFNALPLFACKESTSLSRRYQTMSSKQAAQMAPVLNDWHGQFGGPHLNSISTPGAGTFLISRRGHPIWVDPFATRGGYNFVVAGDTRSGKTFFTNQLVFDHLQSGGQGWVIEIGRGFEKMCKVLQGDHIRFSETSEFGMNPFSTVENIDDEIDELVGIFSAMIDPSPVVTERTGLSAEDKSVVREAIRAVWGATNRNATPTSVANFLFAQDKNPRAQSMARMMAEYREDGAYGHWFNKPMDVDLSGRFVVLELEELKSRPGLQMVVLLQMMFAINREIQQGAMRDNRRRMLFVDEASELLKIPAAAEFMEGLYRRAGKSRGSVGVGVQRVDDLYRNAQSEVIVSQSESMYLLRQRTETITNLQRNERLGLDDWGFALLRSLRRTNDFSEVMVFQGGGYVVGRLTVDAYRRVLFSSTGAERDAILGAIDQGQDPAALIAAFANPVQEQQETEPAEA